MNSLPSPASSPSPPSLDSSAQPSRKRQRSQSMHSDKSSASVKRSVSEAPMQDATGQNTQADQMSTLSLADQNRDIDAYMATQGEASIPDTLLLPGHSQETDTAENMSPMDRLRMVEDGKKKAMHLGETWFLVSRDWWKRWRKACTGEQDKEGPVTEQDLDSVDNSSLLDSQGGLRSGLIEGEDVEFVPDEIWRRLITWYGESHHVLSRRVVPRGAAREPTLELYPPRFKVSSLTKSRRPLHTDHSPSQWVTISSGETIEKLCTRLARAVKPTYSSNTPYRVWRVDANDSGWDYHEFPCERVSHGKGRIIEESTRTLEEEGLESEDGFVVEFKQHDGWIVDSNEIQPQLPTVTLPVFNSTDSFFNTMGNGSSSTKNRGSDPVSPLKPSPSKPSPSSSLLSSPRNSRVLEPGTLGLTNMGNTCFMNSALQCLAHTKELSDYFLSGVFEAELNTDNPLGMGGAIAEAFGALLQRIWATSGPSTAYSPREFKQALQRFAPQFSGYQQHDSQELVAFLLDGLHEDLNRILKKPYVEKPDWEGGGDLDLVQLAKKSWDGYLLRNDSVIVDLFQGQYQSTLVCPECEKVSITFDPFMYLTLPIPIQKKWTHTIFYVPWDTARPHCKVPVELNREASFRDVRNLLGRWMDVPPDNLLTLEIFSHKFYKNLDDNVPVGDMAENDTIVCFELPCNAQQQRGYKRQPGDPLILPVFLCDTKAGSWNSYSSRVALFGYPTVVVMTPEEASSMDAIYGAVIERLLRFTSHSRDLYDWEAGNNSGVGTHVNSADPDDLNPFIEIGDDDIAKAEDPPEEGDIVDEKNMVVDEDISEVVKVEEPRVVGYKKGVFNLRLHSNHRDFGASNYAAAITHKWESWERREEMLVARGSLLREDDALYCEFDENMKAYYFGESISRFEHARWDIWEEFIHPEFEELRRIAMEKKDKGISLRDCLDEFTKEEKLGEDDLWYCPRCKKHQQATKRFDLWKAPDILVVHLKRFSNSRTLRDKIDAFIDFPIKGLDLESMVGERAVAKRLQAQGADIGGLNLTSLDEPLVYDLFGVDEHIGGLGGGHYRAYALNHPNNKWYHFDDSFVKPAHAEDAVNADAYLLFYRRRTNKPLGGKSQERIIEFKTKTKAHEEATPSTLEVPITIDNQLPTPPDDSQLTYPGPPPGDFSHRLSREKGHWAMRSGASVGSQTPSDDPPAFDLEEGPSGTLYFGPLGMDDSNDGQFDYAGGSSPSRPSPSSSSLAAEIDFTPLPPWNDGSFSDLGARDLGDRRGSPSGSNDWGGSSSNLASPSYSDPSSDNTNDTSGHQTFTTAVEDAENLEREQPR